MSKKSPLTRTNTDGGGTLHRRGTNLLTPSPRRVQISTPSPDLSNRSSVGSRYADARYGEGDDYFGVDVVGAGSQGGSHGGSLGGINDPGPAFMTPVVSRGPIRWSHTSQPSITSITSIVSLTGGGGGASRPTSPRATMATSPGASPPLGSPRISPTPLASPLLIPAGARPNHARMPSHPMVQLQLPSPPSSPPTRPVQTRAGRPQSRPQSTQSIQLQVQSQPVQPQPVQQPVRQPVQLQPAQPVQPEQQLQPPPSPRPRPMSPLVLQQVIPVLAVTADSSPSLECGPGPDICQTARQAVEKECVAETVQGNIAKNDKDNCNICDASQSNEKDHFQKNDNGSPVADGKNEKVTVDIIDVEPAPPNEVDPTASKQTTAFASALTSSPANRPHQVHFHEPDTNSGKPKPNAKGRPHHPNHWGWGWFRSDMFSVLAILVPLGLSSGICGWAPKTVFTLCAVSLAGLEVFVNTTLERVSLSYDTIPAALLLEILPVLFPTMIGIAAVYADATMLAKSFVIGYVLNNILLGTGAALFSGGIKSRRVEASFSQDISESALELIKLTLIATGPVMMTWAMIYVTTIKTAVSVDPGDGTPASTYIPLDATEAIVALSRGTSVILLVLYMSWVVFRRITHRSDFADDDRERRVAVELVRVGHAVPFKGHGGEATQVEAQAVSTSRKEKRVFESLPTPVACIVVPTAIFAALASAVVCSYYLVASIQPIVQSTYEGAADTAGNGGFPAPATTITRTASASASATVLGPMAAPMATSPASSSLPSNSNSNSSAVPEATSGTLKGHFVASIVLPLVVNVYNFMRAAEIASCGGRDVSLAVHMTYGAGANTILLTLPLLVLVGWWSGHTLNLDFQSFDVSILAGSVWATSILVTEEVDYFRGFMLLCLYIIVALAIFLYKE